MGGFVERLKEGTYLAHVIEHLCLETQKILGYDIKYGKARQVKDDIYNVIFSCVYTEIGKACGIFVINTINALIEAQEVDIENEIQSLRKLCVKYNQGISTSAIIQEARNRDIPVNSIYNGEVIRLGYGRYQKLISATLYEDTSGIAVDIACNKQLTKRLLDEVSIPVPYGETGTSFELSI